MGSGLIVMKAVKDNMSEKLFVFDLDETLVACDSCVEWHKFLVERGIITDPGFLAEDQRLMNLYAEGVLDMAEYIRHSMAPLAEITCAEIDLLVEECARSRILPNAYPEAKKLLAGLRQNKRDVIIISATHSFIVCQVAKLLGVNTAMGIDLAVKNGAYSDEVTGIPTFRAGKVKRLNVWLQEHGGKYGAIEFYTDSINDLPLCEHADFVNIINPCKKLEVIARARFWNIYNWVL